MKWLTLILALFVTPAYAALDTQPTIPNLADYPTRAEAAALAPVQSVNTNTGAVSVPTVQRQVSSPLDITSGTATWTFPTAFTNMPTCWPTISSSASTFVFSSPVTTSISKTSVTVSLSAANKVLAVSIGSLTVWATPPSGATVTLSCVGALP